MSFIRHQTFFLISIGFLIGCGEDISTPLKNENFSPAMAVLTPQDEKPIQLSALSFNMWHKNRPEELKIMAEHLHLDLERLPDFILCQEAVFKKEFNTAQILGDLLDYETQGTKRKSDREGLAIISRFPFEYYDFLHLKARTAAFFLGFRRVSVMGEFLVPNLGRVRIVNVHLAHPSFEHHIRKKQIKETLSWILKRDQEVPADLIFFGGDFNAKPDWKELTLIKGPDAFEGLNFKDFNSNEPSMGSPGKPTKRIDYHFIEPKALQVVLLEEQLLWNKGLPSLGGKKRFFLSDHLPLLHSYEFSF